MRKSRCIALILLLTVVPCTRLTAQEPSVKIPTGSIYELPGLAFEDGLFRFRFSLDHIEVSPADIGGFISLRLPGFYPDGRKGSPALPRISRLFEAGAGEVEGIEIMHADSVVIDLGKRGIMEKLAPYVPSVRKGAPVPEVTIDPDAYGTDEWIGEELICVEYEGILRGLPMSTLHVSPVRYNPVKNQLKIYSRLDCRIRISGSSSSSVRPGNAFRALYNRVVRKGGRNVTKSITAEQPMTLVILSDTLFRQALRPFVEWKTRKGFRIVEAYRQDPRVGTTLSSMKSYLESLYAGEGTGEPPPEFLLIVGDVEQIPLSQPTGQITDLYYTTFDGAGDYIPDMFYGRISVNSTGQLEDVLEKILQYEQYQFPDPSFLGRSVLIAGVDGSYASTHGNGQINYAHLYLNASKGNEANLFLYPGSDTSDQAILDLISEGVGFVNYTGHGLYDRWINPTFHQNDIDGLENNGAYPVMIGNGCKTNVYNLGECFAEALLRAPGKGALAYIGCTNDSYWTEDYYWAVGVGPIVAEPAYESSTPGYYDRVFHTHGEPYSLWAPTLGEMVFGGNMSVQESHSARKKFYWEIYQLAGDPTLVPWFVQAEPRNVIHPPVLPPGSHRMDLTTAPYDYAALSVNGTLLDAAHANPEGALTLYLPDTLVTGPLDLVVTGDRYTPYLAAVPVESPAGSFLQLDSYTLVNESVEKDKKINPGEFFSFTMNWINRGQEQLEGDTLVLNASTEGVEVMDSIFYLGPVEAGDTLEIQEAFQVKIAGSLKDQELISLGILGRSEVFYQPVYLKEKMAAPVLRSAGLRWDDRPLGNGNGIAEKGEWLNIEWTVKNEGHFRTGEVEIEPIGNSAAAFSEFEAGLQGPVVQGDSMILRFNAATSLDPSTQPVTVQFKTFDQAVEVSDSFTLYTGRHFENFDGGESGSYAIINESVSPWRSDSEHYYSSPRSFRSGSIGNYQNSEFTLHLDLESADSISFAFRVSSEYGWDFLRFYTDSILVSSWSGEREWDRFGMVLEAGHHEVTWSYKKDGSISKGSDAAWVDDILFPASSFTGSDLSLMEILEPQSGPWLTGSEQLQLRIRNAGSEPTDTFTIRLITPDGDTVRETVDMPLLSGEESELRIPHWMDLSGFGTYPVAVYLEDDSDQFRGNNYLIKEVEHYRFPDLRITLSGLESEEGHYVDAVVELMNEGNVTLDTFRFEIRIGEEIREQGIRWIGLEPGETLKDTFRVADSDSPPGPSGFYRYQIRSLDTDSVSENHSLEGELFWTALLLEDPIHGSSISVFPNPASAVTTLRLDPGPEEPVAVELVDELGKILGQWSFDPGRRRLQIPLQDIETGPYIIRIDHRIVLPLVIAR